MSAFHILQISITTLPGLPELEWGRWHPACTQDLGATGSYHEITRAGLLVRFPVACRHEGSAMDAPAGVPYTGNLRFERVPGGAGGVFAARLREGRVLWVERLDYARFQGRSRLYYREGHPIVMTDDEYRERRRADHEEVLTEDHAVSALSPRAASDGGGVWVETRSGARFEVVPEGELALPKPGDEVRLYLVPGRIDGAPGEIVGVSLNGESVYYETPEEHARRSRRTDAEGASPTAQDLRSWSRLWSQADPAHPTGSSASGFAANEGTMVFTDYPEAERRAERCQEAHEEAHRRERLAGASRLMGHALNLSHAATDRPTLRRLDAERVGRDGLFSEGGAGGEGEAG